MSSDNLPANSALHERLNMSEEDMDALGDIAMGSDEGEGETEYPSLEEFIRKREALQDGVPCEHPGCLSHQSHPCEGCGRISGRRPAPPPSTDPGGVVERMDYDIGTIVATGRVDHIGETCSTMTDALALIQSQREEIEKLKTALHLGGHLRRDGSLCDYLAHGSVCNKCGTTDRAFALTKERDSLREGNAGLRTTLEIALSDAWIQGQQEQPFDCALKARNILGEEK